MNKGFGLKLTNQLLERGFNVAATSRNKQQLSNSVNNKFVTNDNFLALQVDLTSDESVKNSINETISKFTRIDIIINNTGYSQCDIHALSENPTTRLFLGPDSMKYSQSKIESIQNDIKLNYDKSSKTDFTN
ncbi:hypothetical protein ACTFIZ_011752 [Dictyostelium cf. discoideum]